MAYDPKAIANYFLDLAESRGVPIEPMKVRNLVYFAHAWHLSITGEPLIAENVQAWGYGPVIPSLLNAFPGPVLEPIRSRAVSHSIGRGPHGLTYEEYTPSLDETTEEGGVAKAILDRVWEVYGHFSAVQLANMSHSAGSPWQSIFDRHGGEIPAGEIIPPGEIRDHFSHLGESRARHASSA